MSIERLRAHYGFSRTPFGRDLAPGMLHRHRAHAEAVARITYLVQERALGVVTGEVGAGKTVAARAATSALDPTRHTIIYLANPAVGTRGVYQAIIRALGAVPRFHKAALIHQAGELEVVLHIAGGLLEVHARELVAQRDPLVERGEGAEADAAAEGGLAEQDAGEG